MSNSDFGTSAQTKQIAAEILRYCSEHPDARDSVAGIAWWVALQRHSDTLGNVRAAVDMLVAEGRLFPHRLSDGSTVFGCLSAAPKPAEET